MSVTLQEAAERRAEAAEKAQRSGGQSRAQSEPPDGVSCIRNGAIRTTEMRAEETVKDGKSYLRLTGFASTYEDGYEMWDWAGPYTEVVSEGAGAASLAAQPDTVFLTNHRGLSLARTTSDNLELSEPGGGLLSDAFMNPKRQDAQDLYQGVSDGTVTEMSFAFRITKGQWSPDYMEYRINGYDIDRGDTSAVNFGANPGTSIEARAQVFHLRNEALRVGLQLAPEREEPAVAALGARALRDLRLIRASLHQGDTLDAAQRATLVALADALVDRPEALRGDGPLDVLLGVRAVPQDGARPTRSLPSSLSFLERELASARRFPN